MSYQWRDVKVQIPRATLWGWLTAQITREDAKRQEKDARLQQMLAAQPGLATELIKAQAEGQNRSAPDFPTDVLRQANELASRIRGLETEIRSLRSLEMGLRAAVNDTLDVPVGIVMSLAPDDNVEEDDRA